MLQKRKLSEEEELMPGLTVSILPLEVDADSIPRCLESYDTSHFLLAAVKEALWAAMGNVTRAALLLGEPRPSLHKYLEEHPELKEYNKNIFAYRNAVRCDFLEDAAFKKALQGDPTMIWKLLQTYGKDRGYAEVEKEVSKVPKHISEMLLALKGLQSGEVTIATQSQTAIRLIEGDQKN